MLNCVLLNFNVTAFLRSKFLYLYISKLHTVLIGVIFRICERCVQIPSVVSLCPGRLNAAGHTRMQIRIIRSARRGRITQTTILRRRAVTVVVSYYQSCRTIRCGRVRSAECRKLIFTATKNGLIKKKNWRGGEEVSTVRLQTAFFWIFELYTNKPNLFKCVRKMIVPNKKLADIRLTKTDTSHIILRIVDLRFSKLFNHPFRVK